MKENINLLNKILLLDKNSSEEYIMNVVEFDLKDSACVGNFKDSIDMFFEWKNTAKVDCEKDIANLEMYKELDWIEKNSDESSFKQMSFDVINSFVNIYAFALLKFYPNDFSYKKSNILVKGKNVQYANSIKFLTEKFETFVEVIDLKCILDLAKLTHSFGNFMPCPSAPYNNAKGTCNDVKDFLDLMLIRIKNKNVMKYKVKGKGKGIYEPKEISVRDMKEWEKWFDDNKEKISIDDNDYQLISSIDDLDKMNINSFIDLVLQINNRIRIRGLKIVKHISDCQEIKIKCDEIIRKISDL